MRPSDFPDGYISQRELGEGSMGQVWLARTTEGAHCAVKILNLRQDRRGSSERSFNREVRAMARLSHPGIIQVHDFGRTPKGAPFVVMEYASGSPLNPYMRGSWTWRRLWTLLDGLLSALGHAHARELIHRDLKPGNVIVMPDRTGPGAVKLADFGIALAMSETKVSERRIEGTPAYIAPEAASGDVASVGPWTDLYSLGVMLFEILTGDLPYHGRHLLAHHQRSPVPPIEIRHDVTVSPEIIPIVRRLLEKVPHRRYRSVAALRSALSELGVPSPAAPLGTPPATGLFMDDEFPDEMVTLQPISGPSGPGLFHIRQPQLVGRRGIQDVLTTAAEAAIAGRGPRLVMLEGHAGVGKSYLGAWLREQLEESGRMRTLVIRSEPQAQQGGGLRAALLRLLGAPTADRDQAEDLFLEAFEDPKLRQLAMRVLWPEDDQTGPMSDLAIREAAELIKAVVGDTPFMLWSDDSQWSPEGRVLQLIHRLARPDGLTHLLVLVTLRPSERAAVQSTCRDLMRLPGAEALALGPVSPLELAPALESLAPLPDGLAEAASMVAAGNPLIAVEAVRSFLETEGLGHAPTDPNLVLQQRIERATSGERGGEMLSALARATLLGRSFTLGPLCKLCSVDGDLNAPQLTGDQEFVHSLLEEAVNSGLAIEQGERRWRFGHDLIRTQLRKTCRQLQNWPSLNRKAASIRMDRARVDPTGIELEVVARHMWEADATQDALQLGLEGLDRLHSSGLMGHANSFARRLIRWDDERELLDVVEKGDLLLMASEAAEHAGQPHEAEQYARTATDLARDEKLAALGARAAGRLGVLKLQHDTPEEAEHWLWDALRFARTSGDQRALADVNLSLGYFYQRREKLDLSSTAYQVCLELAVENEMGVAELSARAALAGLDRVMGHLERAEKTFEAVATRAQEKGLEVIALNARLQLGLCAKYRNDPATAWDTFEEVRSGARGNLFSIDFFACLGAAWAAAAQGRWHEAETPLMHAEDLRYDVRLRDPEAEEMRISIRKLATDARRPDIVERIKRLDILRTKTGSTQHSL
ncbi:MAG: protein kinase [Myxococcota bacterium]|nr:protein kinase [Myxococcota bacterium]